MIPASSSLAQTTLNSLSSVVFVIAPEKVIAKRGSTQPVEFTVQVKSGYHVNSNTPEDEFLIPLRFTFTSDSGVQIDAMQYPKPTLEKLQFSTKPVSVLQGDFKTKATLKIQPTATAGLTHVLGKLRYQACNDRLCLPPRTLEVKIPVEIRN
ncbi:MAG: hypothetical protein H7039_22015 [Bryobacteraceae bacterium]|nr:hypothetical protein [Bryobacteraceae bacterium]